MTITEIINERIEHLRDELNAIKPPIYEQVLPDGRMTYFAIQEELRHWLRLAIEYGMTTTDEAAIRADERRILAEKADSLPGSPTYYEAFKHVFGSHLYSTPKNASQLKTTGLTHREAILAAHSGKTVRRGGRTIYGGDNGNLVMEGIGTSEEIFATDWEIVE